MKKTTFLWILTIIIISLTWCWKTHQNTIINSQPTIQEDITAQNNISIYDTLKTIIKNHSSCDDDSEIFVDFAILWTWENNNWNTEYYLVTNWQWFYIDERWNLNNSCGFGNTPTLIELSQDTNWYNLIKYEVAKDWSEYDDSTKQMFSNEAYKIRKDAKYTFIFNKSLLEQAEEYFWIKIIPEINEFECTFCDKLRYYEPNYEDTQSNDLIFNYTSIDNWNNTIYFWNNRTFEAKWSRDEWKWTRTFWKDENTIIVENENSAHIYNRYIITNQDEESLNTILEIIQRR